jgi:hypothetical protein
MDLVFLSLLMHIRSYTFIIVIIEILIPFSFPTILYHFRFRQNNLKVKVMESFSILFSHTIWQDSTLLSNFMPFHAQIT